jgi:hypothetical protein
MIIALLVLIAIGFITVATETFTHLIVHRSILGAIKEHLLESCLFTITSQLWALTIWFLVAQLGRPVALSSLAIMMALAHLPLLAYPLTIVPTLGYRLEQLLRLQVFLGLSAAISFQCGLNPLLSALIALPGWLLHFLSIEWRLLRRNR